MAKGDVYLRARRLGHPKTQQEVLALSGERGQRGAGEIPCWKARAHHTLAHFTFVLLAPFDLLVLVRRATLPLDLLLLVPRTTLWSSIALNRGAYR
jgi:hypothetical protein